MRVAIRIASTICVAVLLFCTSAGAIGPVQVDQGPKWTGAARYAFYSQDQGSQVMPLSWMLALKQPNGAPFMQNSLARYGFLPNPLSLILGLPVGFSINTHSSQPMIGMSCAACHTRQIQVNGVAYRIDGGPAFVDNQSLFADIDTAVNTVLTKPAAFAAFARAVLGPFSTPGQRTQLKNAVAAWYLRYDTLMAGALPAQPWGVGRIDAIGVILDRITGIDLGDPPGYLIPENIRPAAAPVRPPFLWNAPMQDRTQWPGFFANGSDLLGQARNIGEVLGVFATFMPTPDSSSPLGVDYVTLNSANYNGLSRLETLARLMGPPKWPWKINTALAAQGESIFNLPTDQGGCVACHGITPGVTRRFNWKTWATPRVDVGSDIAEYQELSWTAQSGALNGASIPVLAPTAIMPVDFSFRILAISVFGPLLQHLVPGWLVPGSTPPSVPDQFLDLIDDSSPPPVGAYSYEARVLQGIWAAAPYLHNGSVPTLAQLLTPSSQRVSTFAIGPVYDPVNVGLATKQGSFSSIVNTTGCNDVSSGNSNCGHEYGTTLSDAQKQALLEYLKSL